MTTYVRNGGAWTQAQPRVRCDGEWKAGDLYVRCDGEWKKVYDNSAGGLLPPESFAASGTDENSTTLTWTNPTQTGGTDPTHIQIRIAQLGAVWTEVAYPVTTWAFSALDASTEYVAQIRYIVRTNGVITDTSTVVDETFTTDAAPIGQPAQDPGGTGGDTVLPFTGSTTNPTAVGTAFGTWWEWKLELLATNALSWSTPNPPNAVLSDDGASQIYGELAGNGTEVSWDDGDLTAGRTYRVCRREVEDTTGNGTADTFGDWVCGDPFPAPIDWGAGCGGATGSTKVTGVSFIGDVTFRFPDACINTDGDMIMRESVSGNQVIKGPGFFSFFTDADDEEGAAPLTTLTSSPFYPTMAVPVGSTVVKGSDWSISTRFRALSAFSGVNGRTYDILTLGGGAVVVNLLESATGWTPSVDVLADGGGFVTLTGSEITYDSGTTHTITLTWDADGTQTLYVDGVSEDTASGTDIYETLTSAGAVTSAPAYLMNMQQIGIDRVLTSGEVSELTVIPVAADRTDVGSDGQAGSYTEFRVAGETGNIIIVSVHHRDGGTTNASAPTTISNTGSWTALRASARYDTVGVSDGAVGLYSATVSSDADCFDSIPPSGQQFAGVSLPGGYTSVDQHAQALGTTDSVSVSLGSSPSSKVYVMLHSGGQQTAITPPSAPAGWTEIEYQEKTLNGGYAGRTWLYEGTSQSFSLTLPSGATTNGGWGAHIVEVS